tara:strand:+ start:481 stop:1335 length:855 start_codon:yes stop_codon:yes gene_type:complete
VFKYGKHKEQNVLDFDSEYPTIRLYEHSKSDNPNKSKNRTYSNQWMKPDTLENYKMTEFWRHTYAPDEFYYDTNANGFRCDDFDTMDFTKKSIIYLGCSHTFGVGLPEEHSWPTITHNKIQKEHNTIYNYINLGVHGAGIDYYLQFLPYFAKFNPGIIISCTPEITRINSIDKNNIISHLTPFSVLDNHYLKTTKKQLSATEIMYRNSILEGNSNFEYKKEVIFANVKSIAKLLNAQFIEIDNSVLIECHGHGEEDNARDSAHTGKIANEKFSEIVIHKLKETK